MSPSAVDRSYVICSDPRSGSNYLCQLLASTGVLGRPADYFNGEGFRGRGYADYPLEPEAQLRQVFEMGRTANGICGLKMFSARFDRIAHLDWIGRLPDPRFVYLEREDLLGQALSEVRASQSGQYRSTASPKDSARYDRLRIRRTLVRFAQQHARWRLFFARNGIGPLRLVYERVVEQPQLAVDAVAQSLGMEHGPPIDPSQITLQVQRDASTDAWRERFLGEERDLSYLDRLLPLRGLGWRDTLARLTKRLRAP